MRIATATGAGSGRFLALTLLDALQGGGSLTAVRVGTEAFDSAWSVDFEFCGLHRRTAELVRVGVAADGAPLAVELWRTSAEHPHEHPRNTALADALRRGGAVSAIRLESAPGGGPRALCLQLRAQPTFRLDLREFVRSAEPS